jgi:hypothetical protein
MSWRHVFDGSKIGIRPSMNRDVVALIAANAGYFFLAWNSEVYFIEHLASEGSELVDVQLHETGIKVEELL